MSNFRPTTRRLAFAIVDFIKKRPALERRMKAMSDWYCDKMGYRKYGKYNPISHAILLYHWNPSLSHTFLGLIKDDLIDDEHEVVREAIRRLPEEVQLARMFRLKRAVQAHTNRDTLPETEWTPLDQVAARHCSI
jgi:Ubiquinol-cytochrome C reductase complex 14kD subunit